MDFNNYKLVISYDGTTYCGWQIQPNGLTIQEVIQHKMEILLKHPVHLIGSGRTDSGVHAKGQVAHFHTPLILDEYRFFGSLNALLPIDIRVLQISKVSNQFHAQYDATGKIYHYHLHLDRVLDPFSRLYSYHVREKIDVTAIREAAPLFIGTHDFTSFANEAHTGSAAHDAVRTIYRLDVVEQNGGIRLEFEGDGFLYKMVRNITGTLLEIGAGKRHRNDIPLLLKAMDRRMAGKAAPPHGLFLMKVHYQR